MFTSTSQVVGWEDWFIVSVKWLAGKIVFGVTYNVLSGTLNHALDTYLPQTASLPLGSYQIILLGDRGTVSCHGWTDICLTDWPPQLMTHCVCNYAWSLLLSCVTGCVWVWSPLLSQLMAYTQITVHLRYSRWHRTIVSGVPQAVNDCQTGQYTRSQHSQVSRVTVWQWQ